MNDNFKIKKQRKYFHEVVDVRSGKKHLLGKTFSTKFFIKLCSNMIESSVLCFTILNFEPENRSKDDIAKATPWLKTLSYFYDFITLKETGESSNSLLTRLAWVLFRKTFQKNVVIRRAGDLQNKNFYLMLQGNAHKLDLVVAREMLSLDEYLIYLIKINIMKEKEIFNKCRVLNKSYVKIKEDNIKNFCKKNNLKNYEILKQQAIKELNKLGIEITYECEEDDFEVENLAFDSLENYLKIFYFHTSAKNLHDKRKAYFNFYLPYYVINGEIKKGKFFGNLLKEEIKDTSTYVSKNKCFMGVINKEMHYTRDLYESIIKKKKKIFKEFINNFFIFHHINKDSFSNIYAPFISYKKYYKGEKIFLQNSIYEGVFLLKSGEINLNINTSIDEMYNLMSYFTYALNGFNEYVSGFITKDYIDEQVKQQNHRINSHHNIDNETAKLYLEKKNYYLMTIKEYNIIGTNESFDHQAEIYKFSAECVSDEALIFFLPKQLLNIMLNKEKMLYNSFIQLVEFRIKDIVGKIKNYIKYFENKIKKSPIKKLNETSDNFLTLTERNNSCDKSLKNVSKKILKKINFSYSRDNYFIPNKNLFLSQDSNNKIVNNNVNYLKKSRNTHSLYCFKKAKTVNDNLKNTIDEFKNKRNLKFSYSNNKASIIKTIPASFPYLIMDSLVKREFFKEEKANPFPRIKTSRNIKNKKFCLNNNK